MQPTNSSNSQTSFFRLLVIVVAGIVLFFAVEGLMNLAIGAGTSWAGETRHGVIAEKGISIAVASVSGTQPIIPIDSINSHGETGLFVFDNLSSQSVKIPRSSKSVDLIWFDSSLFLISVDSELDLSLADQAISSPPGDPALFLLVAPAGFADEVGVRRGDRLVLL